MFQKTGSHYGVNEVLLASVLGSLVFSIFAAQPLVIVGVTGLLNLFRPPLVLPLPFLTIRPHHQGPITVFN